MAPADQGPRSDRHPLSDRHNPLASARPRVGSGYSSTETCSGQIRWNPVGSLQREAGTNFRRSHARRRNRHATGIARVRAVPRTCRGVCRSRRCHCLARVSNRPARAPASRQSRATDSGPNARGTTPRASSLASSLSIAAWQYWRILIPLRAAVVFNRRSRWGSKSNMRRLLLTSIPLSPLG